MGCIKTEEIRKGNNFSLEIRLDGKIALLNKEMFETVFFIRDFFGT